MIPRYGPPLKPMSWIRNNVANSRKAAVAIAEPMMLSVLRVITEM